MKTASTGTDSPNSTETAPQGPPADVPDPSVGPEPDADPASPAAQPALPLEYENAWPQWVAPSPLATAVFWMGVRRVIVAGAVGLLAWGLVSLAAGVNRSSAPAAAAWGLAFLVLMLPLRLRLPWREPPHAPPRRRKPKRHRRPARQRGAED